MVVYGIDGGGGVGGGGGDGGDGGDVGDGGDDKTDGPSTVDIHLPATHPVEPTSCHRVILDLFKLILPWFISSLSDGHENNGDPAQC